jgi:Ser/Thr protein kinase RdoA (MazF antagonist)
VTDQALVAARRRIAPRPGRDLVIEHLEAAHGIAVADLTQLDLGVYRVGRRDGPAWVARVFPANRPAAATTGDADILELLAGAGYPAERPAAADPVSELAGHGVLVTEFAEPVPREQRREAIRTAGGLRRLGELLAELHALPPPPTPADRPAAAGRPGGGWHHLVDGTGPDEVAAARALLAGRADRVEPADQAAYDQLRRELDDVDDGTGLPVALTHPDFVLANVVAPAAGGLLLVDWSGAGTGSRAWTLAFLLWAEGARNPPRADLVAAGYRRHIRLEPAELTRLTAMMRARPVVLAVWSYCLGRATLAGAVAASAEARDIAAAIGPRAATALTG